MPWAVPGFAEGRELGTGSSGRVVAASPTSVVIEFGDLGGSDMGGPQVLYHVDATGHATEYGTAAIPDSKIPGAITNFAISPTGGQIAVSTDTRGGICGFTQTTELIDTTTGATITAAMPAGGGPDGYWVEKMWFDEAGTPYASLVPNDSDCAVSAAAPSQLWPADAMPAEVKLVGGTWVKTGTSVYQAAYAPGNWLAADGATLNQVGPSQTALLISHGTSNAMIPIAITFAWGPQSPGSQGTPGSPGATGPTGRSGGGGGG